MALFLVATPAKAWDFTPVPVCTLFETNPEISIRVTYDPGLAQPYAIALTRSEPWPVTATFGLRFDGPSGMSIGTDRHQLSPDGRTLTVTDTGFDNVLNGLSFNLTATAVSGDVEVSVDLRGARPAVEAFRACGEVPSA